MLATGKWVVKMTEVSESHQIIIASLLATVVNDFFSEIH